MRKGFLLLTGLFLFLFSACSPRFNSSSLIKRMENKGSEAFLISSVPFIPQKKDYCGPAALAMVLNFYGSSLTQEEIGEKTYLPSLKGAFIFDLAHYAQKLGFETKIYRGSLEDLHQHILASHPLIILQDRGFGPLQLPHYLVVVGFDQERKLIIAHSAQEKNALFDYDHFLSAWEKTNYLTLLVLPLNRS